MRIEIAEIAVPGGTRNEFYQDLRRMDFGKYLFSVGMKIVQSSGAAAGKQKITKGVKP